MSQKNKPANPFYVLLILAGLLFAVTACAYGVMTVKGLHPDTFQPPATAGSPVDALAMPPNEHPFMVWIDKNGFQLMMVELAALAILTFAAIGTDEYWTAQERKTTLERQLHAVASTNTPSTVKEE